MSNFIPKNRSAAYRPWQLKTLEGGGDKHSRGRDDAERVTMINRQAYREGLEAGFAKGAEQARQEAVRLAALADSLNKELTTLEHNVATDLVRLSLTLARELVRESLKVHPELIEAIVRDALGNLPPFNQGARLRLHPEDAALLAKHLAPDTAGECTIVEDPNMTRGGCKVETATGEVDATLEARWQKLTLALALDHEWIA